MATNTRLMLDSSCFLQRQPIRAGHAHIWKCSFDGDQLKMISDHHWPKQERRTLITCWSPFGVGKPSSVWCIPKAILDANSVYDAGLLTHLICILGLRGMLIGVIRLSLCTDSKQPRSCGYSSRICDIKAQLSADT